MPNMLEHVSTFIIIYAVIYTHSACTKKGETFKAIHLKEGVSSAIYFLQMNTKILVFKILIYTTSAFRVNISYLITNSHFLGVLLYVENYHLQQRQNHFAFEQQFLCFSCGGIWAWAKFRKTCCRVV